MNRIVNTETGLSTWRGEEYLVDGRPGLVEPPLVIMQEIDLGPPSYNPANQAIHRTEGIVGGSWVATYSIVPIVPSEVSAGRAKYVLRAAGLESKVIYALGQLPDPQRSMASALWNANEPFRRSGVLVSTIIEILPELTEEVVDELFRQAAEIED